MSVWLLLRKDVRVLLRSPALLGALLAYPVVIALLVGLVAGYASSKPRVAFVDEDHIPPVVQVAGHRFRIQTIVDEVARNVTLVRLDPAEARRELADGRVTATIVVPPGFLVELRSTTRSPSLILKTTSGGLAPRVRQQMQALVYQLNRKLQDAFVSADLAYVRLIIHGGATSIAGVHYQVLGLERMQAELAAMPPSRRVAELQRFAAFAKLALAQTGNALQHTANPIGLREPTVKGRTWVLSAQVQAYGIALTITFLALLLAAGAAAAEKDEGTLGRLARGVAASTARGLVHPAGCKPAHPGVLGRVESAGSRRPLRSWAAWFSLGSVGSPSQSRPLVPVGRIVWAKCALAALAALVLGGAIAVIFGAVVDIGGVTGGEPWTRLPLLLLGVVLAGAVVGAGGTLLGALAREARTASLVAVLVVLPIVFLGLVPKGVSPALAWVNDLLPFVHAVRFFASALFDTSPWHRLGIETAWLLGIGAVLGALARGAMRRLAA